MTVPVQSLLLLSQIHKPCLPCQYHSPPLLLSPVFTFLPRCSCSRYHPRATLCLSGGSCHLFLLLTEVPLPSNSLVSYSTPAPHLTATTPDCNSQFCLDIKWTNTENREENLPVEIKSPLWVPYWEKKSCSPSYTWIQLFRDGSCAVRSHQWFLRDKASSIQTQITDFSCQMLMLLLSQGKLRYF